MEKKIDFGDCQSLAIKLVRSPSITGTLQEASFPDILISLLREIPFFRQNPDFVSSVPIEGDARGRRNVLAFAPGDGDHCVVLSGHYDVVDTRNYGALEPFAFDPETLGKKMLQSLSQRENISSSEMLLKKDLETGAFLPGRGMLDMKSGLAAGISVLARFLGDDKRKGNLLFLAVADEEGSSAGMKAARRMLKDFAASHHISYQAVINLDAAVDFGDGADGKAVFTGSVSKLLPFALFIGKPSHAGAPFEGISPLIPASIFVKEIESNNESFRSRFPIPGEEPAPPSVLYFRELRTRYDVTTPSDAFCAVNIVSYEKYPEKIFERFRELVRQSLVNALSLAKERASAYARRRNEHVMVNFSAGDVVDVKEIVKKAEHISPGILDRLRQAAESKFPDDPVQQTAMIVHELVGLAPLEGLSAVVGIAPPFYAKAELDETRDKDFLLYLKDEIDRFNKDFNESIRIRPFFPGISDMSFLAPAVNEESLSFIKEASIVSQPDLEKYLEDALNVPVINIGPWGREYHQSGERVHRRYAFTVVPEFLYRLCNGLLVDSKKP